MNTPALPPLTFLYVVRCTFAEGTSKVAQSWLNWLRETHLAEVLAAGAVSAEVLRIQAASEIYEIHYRFANKSEFDRYEREQAPRLRADGLGRFPLSLGLQYERKSGQALFSAGVSAAARSVDSD